MSDPAYVQIFDRLKRIGLKCDLDLRWRVAVRVAKANYDKEDPTFERLTDIQFKAHVSPIVDELTKCDDGWAI